MSRSKEINKQKRSLSKDSFLFEAERLLSKYSSLHVWGGIVVFRKADRDQSAAPKPLRNMNNPMNDKALIVVKHILPLMGYSGDADGLRGRIIN